MTLDEIVQDAVNAASATAKAEGIAEGIEKGKAEGIAETLIDLVSKGVLTIEQAAEQAGLPIDEFQKLIE